MTRGRGASRTAAGLLAVLAPALLCTGCGRGARSDAGEAAKLPIEITAEHPVPSPGAEELAEEAAPAAEPPSSP